MTGTAFRRFRQEIPHSLSDLADRWGCSKQNVQKKEEMDEVTQIYADAMRTLVREPGTVGRFSAAACSTLRCKTTTPTNHERRRHLHTPDTSSGP